MTNYPILTTKLNRPRCFQKYYRRERLEKLLDENSDKVATLIVAGAGYGKSTLVSQWLDDKKAVWVSCDAEMNQPHVFISYIVEGFMQQSIHAFKQTYGMIQSLNDIDDEILINTFFTEANAVEIRTIVVLDDFHLLKDESIKDMLNKFLNYPPKNIHIIAITRQDPTIDIEKHRLNNSIGEIRMQDLNLTQKEIKEYGKTCFVLNLSKEQVDQLHKKTEGGFWAVHN